MHYNTEKNTTWYFYLGTTPMIVLRTRKYLMGHFKYIIVKMCKSEKTDISFMDAILVT